jgi:hypothetical protein
MGVGSSVALTGYAGADASTSMSQKSYGDARRIIGEVGPGYLGLTRTWKLASPHHFCLWSWLCELL